MYKQKGFSNKDNNSNQKIYFENLPNELLLQILSYLNIIDIFRSFHGCNKRFDDLVYASARHITVTSDTNNQWLAEHISQFESKIEIVSVSNEYLGCLFGNNYSFPKLRLIHLYGDEWNMSVRTEDTSTSFALMSSLNVLRKIYHRIKEFSINGENCIRDVSDYSNSSLCPFIERLSINICSANQLSVINEYMPNLTHLKIDVLGPDWDDIINLKNTVSFEPMTHLAYLNITIYESMGFNLFKQLINSCQASLKNITVKIHCRELMDGHDLEQIFKSCEKLKKLAFFIVYQNVVIDVNACQYSFQSEWWLDIRRPVVYIQHNNTGVTIIASMPCHFSFAFKNNLYNWYFNKGNQNSSHIRFTNINEIDITNNINQLISLEYLYDIDRKFSSSNQCLHFNFCNLESVDIIYDLFMDDTSLMSVLSNVNHFIISSQNILDSKMLTVWILLASNLKILDISNLTTFNKLELPKELNDMITNEKCLQSSFNRINKLIIFKTSIIICEQTKQELIVTYEKVFSNANIC
ncbi:unnamed protein product [Adineta steineri]|uniref:F-box domain-containing protein n=3 Tax=Adineta steineri TaxID=433720 RepID=A0A818QWK8_9BILA|nr:unnamed protein product [Adineta steineri]